jgi:Domain of unknown function (DUF3459)
LLRLRRDLPALGRLDKDALEAGEFAESNAIVVRRWTVLSHVFAVFHLNPKPSQLAFTIPAGHWQKKLDSAELRWGDGASQASDLLVSEEKVQMSLSPWAVVLYAQMSPEKQHQFAAENVIGPAGSSSGSTAKHNHGYEQLPTLGNVINVKLT